MVIKRLEDGTLRQSDFFRYHHHCHISPLSAVLIIPQLRWWDVSPNFAFAPINSSYKSGSGFLYFNTSHEKLYPNSIDHQAVPKPDDCWSWSWSCPYYKLTDMYQFGRDSQKYGATADIVAQEEANVARFLSGANNQTTFSKGYKASATLMSGLTRNHATLWLFARRVNMKLASVGKPVFAIKSKDPAKPLMRPLLQVPCGMPIDISTRSAGDQVLAQFRTDEIKLRRNDSPLSASTEHRIDVAYHIKDFAEQPHLASPRVSFVDLSTNSSEPLIGVTYSASFASSSGKSAPFPNMTGMSFPQYPPPSVGARALFACVLVPHWISTAAQLDPSAGNIVGNADKASPSDWTDSTFLDDSARPTAIDSGYMNAINAQARVNPNTYSRTVFEYEFCALGIRTPDNFWFDSDWSDKWPALSSTMSSLQMADAIAKFQHNADLFMWFADPTKNVSINLKDLNNHWYAMENAPNQIIYGHEQEIRNRPDLYTELDITVQRFGYAWSLGKGWRWNSDALKRFAIFVILIHSMLVIAHRLAVLVRFSEGHRWRCVTWSTPLSVVLLALQTPSDQVSRIRGTSTGVQDKRTYRDGHKFGKGTFKRILFLIMGPAWESLIRGMQFW